MGDALKVLSFLPISAQGLSTVIVEGSLVPKVGNAGNFVNLFWGIAQRRQDAKISQWDGWRLRRWMIRMNAQGHG